MILWATLGYAVVGAVYAAYFVFAGAARLDPVIRTTPLRTRILFAPGALALWPLMVLKSRKAGGSA
ncbi:MAG: hypothetical protein H6813_01630 [Phycisphaeraceae bacterium]|nr:hypothetical protein [Phycisphaeraceae bacterium]